MPSSSNTLSTPSFTLCFDVSGPQGTLAILKDTPKSTQIVAEHLLGDKMRMAETLLPDIQILLENLGIEFPQIGPIVTSQGPGSFTGIRIGLSVAQGLALAAQARAPTQNATKAYALNALAVWGWKAAQILKSQSQILVLLDSARREAYGQLFHGTGLAKSPPQFLSPEDAKVLIVQERPQHIVGTALDTEPFESLKAAQADKISLPHPFEIRASNYGFYFNTLTREEKETAHNNIYHPFYLKAPDVTLNKN